jgi:DNA-binding transcriptional LysR family regulator
MPGTALRSLFLQILHATDALDPSTQFLPMDFAAAIDALIAGEIDVAVVPRSDETFLQRLIETRQLRSLAAAGFFLAFFIGTPVRENLTASNR